MISLEIGKIGNFPGHPWHACCCTLSPALDPWQHYWPFSMRTSPNVMPRTTPVPFLPPGTPSSLLPKPYSHLPSKCSLRSFAEINSKPALLLCLWFFLQPLGSLRTFVQCAVMQGQQEIQGQAFGPVVEVGLCWSTHTLPLSLPCDEHQLGASKTAGAGQPRNGMELGSVQLPSCNLSSHMSLHPFLSLLFICICISSFLPDGRCSQRLCLHILKDVAESKDSKSS